MFGERTETDRQTATLNYEMSTIMGKEDKDEPSKDFPTVNGTGTGHET
jgi:hypothetical protein